MVEDVFVTVTGMKFQSPSKRVRPGDVVHFIKDVQNDYDEEAIAAFSEDKEQIGYIANSSRTVAKGTYSAGRVYDRFAIFAVGIVLFIVKDEAIVRMIHFQQPDEEAEVVDRFSISIRKH